MKNPYLVMRMFCCSLYNIIVILSRYGMANTTVEGGGHMVVNCTSTGCYIKVCTLYAIVDNSLCTIFSCKSQCHVYSSSIHQG